MKVIIIVSLLVLAWITIVYALLTAPKYDKDGNPPKKDSKPL